MLSCGRRDNGGLRFDELGTLDPFDKLLLPGIASRDTLDASSGLDIL